MLGQKLVAFRSIRGIKGLHYILFEDGKTYLEFDEQDYYSYHDCSFSAREITFRQNAELWSQMFACEGEYTETKPLGFDPF